MKTRPIAIASKQQPAVNHLDTGLPADPAIAPDLIARRNAYENEAAIRAGREALQHARETLERAAEDIKRYEERYENAEPETLDGRSLMLTKANVLGWALGYIASSILGNTRLDLIADAQAKLQVQVAREHDA
jgi:hypothetical protein